MSELRRGFCPSLWTPMASGDGLIVRVRAGSRALRSAELRALALVAGAHGAGLIELTRRANLQLRGLRADQLPSLQRALLQLGLVEASPELERRLALLVSPDVDPALAAALERALRVAPGLPDLPSKFGIVLDAQSERLDAVSADIRLRVSSASAALGVGGRGRPTAWLGSCSIADAPDALCQLIRLQATGRDPAWLSSQLQLKPAAAEELGPSVASRGLIGYQRGRVDFFGLGVPFGSAPSEVWQELAAWSERFGCGELRMTPSRAVLLLGVRASEHRALSAAAAQLGLIVDAGDPLLRVEACPGAPACASAEGETRSLARALASQLRPDASLHVSGCSKGCAHSGPSAITVVRAADGCRLGLAVDAAQAAMSEVLSLDSTRARFDAWAHAHAPRQA